MSKEYGYYQVELTIIVCPNPECRKQIISLAIHEANIVTGTTGKRLYSWQLEPESNQKPWPDYIPLQLRNDYSEACLIQTKSPKASATLSRRCIQGMIRDFWGIQKGRLVDEVNELHTRVDSATWEAIDSVRKVGNIGAHMEKDVNLIIDVEPEEAGLLIWLIETLFKDWYVARDEKQKRMSKLKELAQSKTSLKSNSQQKT